MQDEAQFESARAASKSAVLPVKNVLSRTLLLEPWQHRINNNESQIQYDLPNRTDTAWFLPAWFLGRRFHDFALAHAYTLGYRKIALDTAQPATGPIKMYLSWGYTLAGTCDWRPDTNYLSVLMSKELAAPAMA